MKTKNRTFFAVDILYISIMILPILCGIVIKILTKAPTEGITISGAQIYFEIPFVIQNIVITESQVNSWFVMVSILGLCLYLTHGLSVRAELKRQHLAEWIVQVTEKMVRGNMGDYFKDFTPFIAAILALSAFSSLLALTGLYAPTSDTNVTAGWAILVFILITYYKFKCGPIEYMK